MEKVKVLLFAANPRGTEALDIAREFREIDEEVRLSRFGDAVELILVPGTRPVDLLRKLNEKEPQVVHFSGHGNRDEIILQSGEEDADASGISGLGIWPADVRDMKLVRPNVDDGVENGGNADGGQPQVLDKSALVSVLRSCNEGNLRLVVMNACHTRWQAEALTEVVDCVVTMNRTISDRAAIKFAASFYGALAYGRSVQNAFNQGVARLSAEGISDAATPELLVRAGVDASRVKLVGSMYDEAPSPPVGVPFIVPFPRNADFVGREADLGRLHVRLSESRSVGIRPAGLTGMGGIGKTQLAVEYVHRYQGDYPDGIFWIDAAGSLAESFARLVTDLRLRWAENDRPRDEQVQTAFAALNRRRHALLVLDNLLDPAVLATPVAPDCIPEDLHCRLLFTTRRHDLGRFTGVELMVLSEDAALRLLLRHPSLQNVLDSAHPDHEHARAVTRMLGRLPLALELAGAYLGKYHGDVSLADYRGGLTSVGALATLGADASELTEADVRRVHDPAVAATIGEQWDAIKDEPARLLLRVASLFPESSALPIIRLSLLSGLGDLAQLGRPSILRRAVRQLDDACLIERLEADQVRLHPLIREFAIGQLSTKEPDDFRRQALERAATALEDFTTLEMLVAGQALEAVEEDLIAVLELCPLSAPDLGARIQAVLRLLQRESNQLRHFDAKAHPTLFAQQVQNRATLIGINPLKSSAEQRLAALGEPHFRLLWRTSRESPGLVRRLTGHRWGITALAVTRDGRLVLSASFDGTLRLWNLRTSRVQQTLALHEDSVGAVAMTPDGQNALSACHDGTIKLWDLATGQLLRTFPAHEATVTVVVMAPDGRKAISGYDDGTLRLWDLASSEPQQTFARHDAGVTAIAVTPDGCRALSAAHDGSLKLWGLHSGQLLRTVAEHGNWVTSLAITPDGQRAVSGSYDCKLKLWSLATGELLHSFIGHGADVTAVAMAPDGQNVVSAFDDGTLALWNLATGHRRYSFVGHEQSVGAVALTADGRYAVSGAFDRSLAIWDLEIADPQPTLAGHASEVTSLAVTPDGGHVVSVSRDRSLKLWDLGTGQPVFTCAGHRDRVSAVAPTPDGRHAFSASHDRTVKLWDLGTGQQQLTMDGHDAQVTSVAVSPDGLWALSGSYDGTLKQWNLVNARLHCNFFGHSGVVTAVAVCPDSRRAISACEDGTLRLWDLTTAQLLHRLSAAR